MWHQKCEVPFEPRVYAKRQPYPQLVCGRPSTAATCVNNFKPTDMASVSKVITSTEVERMRRNVQAYYDSYLAPEAFLDRLLHHPASDLMLFVITEAPVLE